MKTLVRWMIRRDFAEVLDIEKSCFGEFAWSEDEFVRALRNRNAIGQVAICSKTDAVVGYQVYELHKGKLEIINLAVDPAHFRQGVGRQLIAKLAGKLNPSRRNRISAIVRESNLGAQLFLRAVGFQAQLPILKGHYDTKEDAYKFVYRPAEAAQPNRESAAKLAA